MTFQSQPQGWGSPYSAWCSSPPSPVTERRCGDGPVRHDPRRDHSYGGGVPCEGHPMRALLHEIREWIIARVKALLRRWFAALVDDEYQRVTKDNVVLRQANMDVRDELVRYKTALAGATVDLREETAARIKAQATAAALEEEVNAAWGVRNRTIRQRDLVIAERDAMRDRLIELGEVMVEVPEHG